MNSLTLEITTQIFEKFKRVIHVGISCQV